MEERRASTIFFRPGSLLAKLELRGESPGVTAKRDLDRYYALLESELKTVKLSELEWNLLRDACNGTLFEAHTMHFLYAEIEDAIKVDGLDTKWKVDGGELIGKLKDYSPGQIWAIIDALGRWWEAQGVEGKGE